MSETIRINLLLSESREGELFKHLQALPVADRASVLKYFAFAGFILHQHKGAADKKAEPVRIDAPSKRKSERKVATIPVAPVIPPASEPGIQYRELIDGNDLGLDF